MHIYPPLLCYLKVVLLLFPLHLLFPSSFSFHYYYYYYYYYFCYYYYYYYYYYY